MCAAGAGAGERRGDPCPIERCVRCVHLDSSRLRLFRPLFFVWELGRGAVRVAPPRPEHARLALRQARVPFARRTTQYADAFEREQMRSRWFVCALSAHWMHVRKVIL